MPATPEVTEAICEWIASGKTLRDYCRQPGTPSWRTVYDWLDADAEFAARFARARDIGADAIAEETLEIIDTEPEMVASEGGSHRDSAHVAWLKNRAWQRMQLLAKWNPKKYGDRVTQEHTGVNGGPIVCQMAPKDADL